MSVPGIFVAIASSGRAVDVRWSLSLVGLITNVPVGTHTTWMVQIGQDRAANREFLAEKAIAAGARYLFMVDDDTICPNTTFKSLIYELEKDPKIMVAGGIYCTKEALPNPLVFKTIGDGPFWNWKQGEVFDCAGLGTGCMMVKTEVFRHLSKPWFFEPHETPTAETMEIDGERIPVSHRSGTDDLYFCQKVAAAGFRLVAHGGVLPIHLDQNGGLYTLPADSYPMRKDDAQCQQSGTTGNSDSRAFTGQALQAQPRPVENDWPATARLRGNAPNGSA
jgi:hypothetical protein